MGQFTLGTKKTLVNSTSDFPLTFWDVNYNVVAPAAARYVNVEGFGRFDLNTIHNVKGHRGLEGFPQVFISDAANVTVSGTIPANTIVRFEFEFRTGLTQNGEYSRFLGRDGKTEVLQILLQPGDTIAELNAKIYNAIRRDDTHGLRELLGTPTPTSVPPLAGTFLPDGTATAIPSLPIFTKDGNLSFTLKVTSDARNLPSPFVTVAPTAFNPILTPSFSGRNNYDVLKSVFMDSWERQPYHIDRRMIPFPGALYTSIMFSTIVHVRDQGGLNIVNEWHKTENHFEIYINESACLPYQNNLVDFLDLATILSTADPILYKAPEWYNAGAYNTLVPAVPGVTTGSPALVTVATAAFKA